MAKTVKYLKVTDYICSVKYTIIIYLKFVLTLSTMVALSSPQSQYSIYICLMFNYAVLVLVTCSVCQCEYFTSSVWLCIYSYSIFHSLFI